MTAGQKLPQSSLGSEQEAAVGMIFPRPLQQTLHTDRSHTPVVTSQKQPPLNALVLARTGPTHLDVAQVGVNSGHGRQEQRQQLRLLSVRLVPLPSTDR